MRIKLHFACLTLVAAALSGCSTTAVNLNYQPTKAVSQQHRPVLGVKLFADSRNETPTYLGSVRGGFGNPLKKVEASRPVAELVTDAFASGLKARGLLAEGRPSRFIITGAINRLDTDRYIRLEANAEITVTVQNTDGTPLFRHVYRAHSLEGSLVTMNTGIFADPDELRVAAEKVMNQVVDQALDDPEFLRAIR